MVKQMNTCDGAFGSVNGWKSDEIYNFLVVIIQEYKDVKTIKIKKMQGSLEAHELMVIDRGIGISVQ